MEQQSRNSWLDLIISDRKNLAIFSAVLVATLEVCVDWTTWIDLNISIVYGLPLVIMAASRNRRLLWSLTVVLILVTMVVYYQQIPPGIFSLTEQHFVNRLLSALALVLTAALLHAWMLAVDALEKQRESIQAKNEELKFANEELLRYKEEITRQNEELQLRREEAEQRSRRKTQLLASVSHDIRNPVNTINLIADAIRRAVGSSDALRGVPRLVHDLESYAHFLVNFVSEVLDFASFDTGQVVIHDNEFSLNELLIDQCARLRILAESKNLFLTLESPEAPVRLRTDRVKLIRIVDNLVSNAIKFTERGGVTVAAGVTPIQGVYIRVSDTGPGIEPADLQRIFDEAVQLSDSGGRQSGWGMGLAICRRFITLMGGDISVESKPGRGSSFEVHLPQSCVTSTVALDTLNTQFQDSKLRH